MKYLKIRNRGELDIRLVSLMGGTTISGNSYKIGRFGTGLKYSLATGNWGDQKKAMQV